MAEHTGLVQHKGFATGTPKKGDWLSKKSAKVGDKVESHAGMKGTITAIPKGTDNTVRVKWETGHEGRINAINLKGKK